mgnify:CR=1 FL=1
MTSMQIDKQLHEYLRHLDGTEATAEDIAAHLGIERDFAMPLMKGVAKKYNEINYVVGRRGHPTRLVADKPFNAVLTARVALSDQRGESPNASTVAPKDSERGPTLTHCYVLRTDPYFEVKLPIDLSEAEAVRLNAYISAISV